MNSEDKDMIKLLDGIENDEKIQLLADITVDETPINDMQRKKIKKGVMRKLKTTSSKKLMKIGMLAASITICVLLSALSPLGRKTLAEIIQKLYFIPGLGKAEVNIGEDIFILPKPIEFVYNQNSITIISVTKNSTAMTINMSGDNCVSERMRIEDEKGNTYQCSNYSYSSRVGIYYFDIPDDLKNFSIILSESDKIPIILEKAESYEDYTAMGPTDVNNGLGLTLVPTILDSKIRFDLIQHQYNDSQVSLYGKSDKEGHSHVNILIHDENGMPHPVEYADTHIGTLSYFNFTPDNKVKKYTIEVPEVTLKYNLNNKVTLPMPKEGETKLNEVLDLQGFPLKLIRVIRKKDHVTFYIDTSYDENKPENISSVMLDMGAMSLDHFKWNLNDQITTESFEFSIDTQDQKLTLYFNEMHTILKGPWEFQISTDY